MPLFGIPKKPLQKRGLGQALDKHWPNNKPVFHIPITDEVFDDYEDYVNRQIMYKLQIWSCQYTGKENMTYDQAFESEKQHKQQDLYKHYPRYVLRHICYMVHMCRKGESFQELAHRMAKFFEYNFIEGEELYCELDTTISVVLRRILLKKLHYYVNDEQFPPFSAPLYITDSDSHQIEVFHQTKAQEHHYDYDLTNIGYGTQGKLYEVDVVSNNSSFENRTIVVYYTVLLRKQSSLIESTDKLMRWLHENTFLDEDGLILLKPELLENFKLEPRAPAQLEVKSKYQKKIDEEMYDIERFKHGRVRSLNDLKYHHVDKLGRLMTDTKEIELSLKGITTEPSSTGTTNTTTNGNSSQTNRPTNGVAEHVEKRVAPVAQPINPLLLPKKDGTVLDEYIADRAPQKGNENFPQFHHNFIIKHPECIPDALNMFNFLFAYRVPLKLDPFTFDEFQHALESKEENNPLLRSILTALLLFLFFDKGTNKQEVNRSIYKIKKLYNMVRNKDQRMINLPSRKQIINREAMVYIAQTIPVIQLREYWKIFMSHELITIKKQEEVQVKPEAQQTPSPPPPPPEEVKQEVKPEEVKQEEPKPAANGSNGSEPPITIIEDDDVIEITTESSTVKEQVETTPPPTETTNDQSVQVKEEEKPSTIPDSNETTTNQQETKTEELIKKEEPLESNNNEDVKKEDNNMVDDSTNNEDVKKEVKGVVERAMEFIKSDAYDDNEIDFFKHLESDVKVYILSKLTEQCIFTATIRDFTDENIEHMKKLKKQKNLEATEDLETTNDGKKLTGEELKLRKNKRERVYQELLSSHTIRAKPLGYDRLFNRYWFFPSFAGVLFVEPCSPFRLVVNNGVADPVETRQWGYLHTKKEIETLISTLDSRGFREKKLLSSLNKYKYEIIDQISLRNSANPEVVVAEDVKLTSESSSSNDESDKTAASVDTTTTESSDVVMSDTVSSEPSPSKKRKHTDDNASDISEVSSSSQQQQPKRTKLETTLEEIASKNSQKYRPTTSSFQPTSFLNYRNTQEETIPSDSECFLPDEDEEESE